MTSYGGQTTSLKDTVNVRGRSYQLGNATTPKWQVDSSSTTTPFYDETNQAWRDASSVTIYDAPTAYDSIVQRELTAGATAVVSRAHFHAYLVRDFSAIYHVEIEIVFTFGPRGAHQTARNVLATGTVTSLPAPLRSALVTGYPAYAYLR